MKEQNTEAKPLVKRVTITVEEYKELLENSDFLSCLEAAGVDNWDGYDEACELFRNGLE